ncbi:MAG TPA: hypothetical protein PK413_02880 [Thermoanaerobaculia bacterium]|nr:hypothetical protein [Thermoanaerobaculia bacterium]
MIRAKVLVVGPAEAGKSTLIRTLCARSMNLAVGGRTVALDQAMLYQGGDSLLVVGVPGQPRFAPVREALAQGTSALVWVHPPGSAPDPSTVELLRFEPLCDIPYVVFVNHKGVPTKSQPFRQPSSLPAPQKVFEGCFEPRGPILDDLESILWELVSIPEPSRL